MNILLLSGGSGKRLWPLSNDTMSKQFLKVLKDRDGRYQSMVQRVFEQIEEAELDCRVTVATSGAQLTALKAQIADRADIVLEPERRDTFPAIALACAHLYYERQVDPGEVVVVLPVDPFAQIEYFRNLETLERLVKEGAGDIVLMGVKPTYPSAKYGYIVTDGADGAPPAKTVLRFKEKPTEAEAARLIEAGALWNCGVFAFRLGYCMELVGRLLGAGSYGEVYERYAELPADSFDREVLEKADSLLVVEYDGVWKDLGTWNTLTEEMDGTTLGKNIVMDDTCENTHVLNVLNLPIVVMGARDMVVVASHDGILVADKHQSSYLKPYADQVGLRPMYEKRQWGSYRVIDNIVHEDRSWTLTRRLHVKAGKAFSCHRHHGRTESWVVTRGRGECLVDGETRPLERGDGVRIGAGSRHALRAFTEMEVIEVQTGTGPYDPDDKEVLAVEW